MVPFITWKQTAKYNTNTNDFRISHKEFDHKAAEVTEFAVH